MEEHIVEADPDVEHVDRLRHQSKDALHTAQHIETTPRTSRSKALLAYDAIRELLEALAHQHGFDVHNHECYRAFLQEVIGSTDVAQAFDDLRRKRNRLEYDADTLSTDQAEAFVETATTVYGNIDYFLDD
jgi:hypothetical protein